MAKYNEILVGRFARYLQKITGIKGNVPTPQLAGELAPVLPFHVFPTDFLHQGWDYYGFTFGQAALAAANSAIRLRNPSGSNVLALILKMFFGNTTSGGPQNYQIDYTNPDGGNLATVVPFSVLNLDARARPTPSVIFSKQNTFTTTGATILVGSILGQTSIDLIVHPSQALPLLPGTAYTVETGSTQNTNLNVSMFWIERYLEESERT